MGMGVNTLGKGPASGRKGGRPMKGKQDSAGSSAVFLTVLAALSQALGFGYRVVLSRMVGAEVMGLYQLLMPAYSVLLSLTAVGLTACASNLSAQYLALGNPRAMEQTRRLCLGVLGGGVCILTLVVAGLYDPISVYLLGDARTQLGLVLLLPCVLLTGVENLHKHMFFGAGLVRPPALVELAEQGIRTAAVLGLLTLFLPQNPERTVGLIVVGMVVCELFSSVTLSILYHRRFDSGKNRGRGETPRTLLLRMGGIALPVGITSLLGNLMGAANASLIPRKLVEGGMSRADAMAEFGVICGMTMPMLSLPTVFLGALNLVVVPRLARSAALCRWDLVSRQAKGALKAASVLLLPAMAMMMVVGEELALLLFGRKEAGEYLMPLGLAVVCSCYHSVFSGILNGVGKQGQSALVSLLCDGVQLAFVFTVALPKVGVRGFVAGVLLSELLGALLCAGWGARAIGERFALFECAAAPGLGALLAGLTGNLLFRYLKDCGTGILLSGIITLLYAAVMYLAALQAQGLSLRDLCSGGKGK